MTMTQTLKIDERLIGGITANALGPFSDAVQSAFDQMAIAEREMHTYTEQFPECGDAIDQSFVQLRWTLGTIAPEAVYTAHVRELLMRVVDGKSLQPGTKAEVLMLLSESSMVAPLGARRAALYVELFEEFYPDAFEKRPLTIHEPWAGSSSELLDELRRKAKMDRRL
jgi:hypothetical protein